MKPVGDVSFDYKDILALHGNDWLNHRMKHPELASVGVIAFISKTTSVGTS
jgi:hypothetical protein